MSTSAFARSVTARTLLVLLTAGLTGTAWAQGNGVSFSPYALSTCEPFLGLGASYFLALRQEKYEEAQLQDNLAFLSQEGFNYIRILSMVNWTGQQILPSWPDYWDQLRQLVDRAYDDYGMRTQITIFADAQYIMPSQGQRVHHVEDLLTEVVAGREHKIILIEVANEYWQNGLTIDEVKQLGTILAYNTPVLVALSSPEGGKVGIPGLYDGTDADVATVHFSRQGAWTSVFDCMDVYDYADIPVSSNEPVGPGSSVYSEENPRKLLMAAAIAWGSNLPMYVFHSRPGITADNKYLSAGLVLINSKSFEELFQKMNFKGRFNFLKSILPPDLPNWTHVTTDAPGNPFSRLEGDGGAIDRSPASLSGADFVSLPANVWPTGSGTLKAEFDLTDVQICDPFAQSCTSIGVVPKGTLITPRAYYFSGGFVITGKKVVEAPPLEECSGTLDYRGDNCCDWKRYQCTPGSDCQANDCRFQGPECYLTCPFPYDLCDDLCDCKPITPCTQRTTQSFCEKGWGCFWQ